MRIRKNAKLSPLLFSSHASAPEALQSHVCHLNQSPWDVISFGPESNQFEGEDSFTGNGSFGDSIGAVESVASKMDSWPTIMEEEMIIEAPLKVFDFDDNEVKPAKVNGIGKTHHCQKNDGKGWQCKKKAKLGYNYCDHHLSLLRSYNSNGGNIAPSSSKKSPALSGGASRRTRPGNSRPAAGKKNGSSNPYEFYYYSGFGPKWGRKRGERDGSTANRVQIKAVVENNSGSSARSSPLSSSTTASPIDNDQFVDFVDDDDDDENDVASGDSGKKRMRKPVKARSLKSLM